MPLGRNRVLYNVFFIAVPRPLGSTRVNPVICQKTGTGICFTDYLSPVPERQGGLSEPSVCPEQTVGRETVHVHSEAAHVHVHEDANGTRPRETGVYRAALDFAAWAYTVCRTLKGLDRPTRDQLLRASQSIARVRERERERWALGPTCCPCLPLSRVRAAACPRLSSSVPEAPEGGRCRRRAVSCCDRHRAMPPCRPPRPSCPPCASRAPYREPHASR